jgi:hypothetical protein
MKPIVKQVKELIEASEPDMTVIKMNDDLNRLHEAISSLPVTGLSLLQSFRKDATRLSREVARAPFRTACDCRDNLCEFQSERCQESQMLF